MAKSAAPMRSTSSPEVDEHVFSNAGAGYTANSLLGDVPTALDYCSDGSETSNAHKQPEESEIDAIFARRTLLIHRMREGAGFVLLLSIPGIFVVGSLYAVIGAVMDSFFVYLSVLTLGALLIAMVGMLATVGVLQIIAAVSRRFSNWKPFVAMAAGSLGPAMCVVLLIIVIILGIAIYYSYLTR